MRDFGLQKKRISGHKHLKMAAPNSNGQSIYFDVVVDRECEQETGELEEEDARVVIVDLKKH